MKPKGMFIALTVFISVMSGKAESEKTEAILPHGFYQEGGSGATDVAVGSKNGRMLAAYLAAGIVYFFNQETMSDNPWIAHKAFGSDGKSIGQCKKICMADDGTVCALSADATTVYRYRWPRAEEPVTLLQNDAAKEKSVKSTNKTGYWVPLACECTDVRFKHISVGSYAHIWAIAENGDVYRLQDSMLKRFQLKPGLTCSSLSAGLDGTVVFITQQAKSYVFKDETWFRFSAAPALSKVAVATKRLMWGVHSNQSDGSSELWKFEGGRWHQVTSRGAGSMQKFTDIALNAAGSLFAVGDQGNIYANGEKGAPIAFVQSTLRGK